MTKRLAYGILFGILLITGISIYQITKLQFNYDFESFFPTDDPDLEFYIDYRNNFETDYEFFLIGIENKSGIFNQSFLKKVESLTDSLSKLNHIVSVQSPTNATSLVLGPFGPIPVPYLHVDKPELYEKDSLRIYNTEYLIGTLFAPSKNAVSIVAQTTDNLSKEKSEYLAKALSEMLPSYGFDEYHLAGRIFGQLYYIEKMKEELSIFMSVALLILIIFLHFIFRSRWGIWVPITVVLLTATWLLGLMATTGKSIDLMTALLPTILFVVGMSDIVHIVAKYLEELRKGYSKKKSLGIAFKEVGLATLLTSITTAIGFLTLTTSAIVPIKEFGIYTAAGVFIAFFLAFTLLPAILFLSPKPQIANKKQEALFWYNALSKSFLFTIRNKKKILLSGVAITFLALIGTSLVTIDNYLLEDLSKNDPHRQDFEYFENEFSGVRPFELSVQLIDSTEIFDFSSITKLEKIEHYLKLEYGVGFIASPLNFVRLTYQAINGGNFEFYKIPESEAEYLKIKKLLNKLSKRPEFSASINLEKKLIRFSGKMPDIGGKQNRIEKAQFDAFIKNTFNENEIKAEITGMAWLIDLNNSHLSSDMMIGLLIAFGVIALIMGIMFRSFLIIVLSLIPNILPLLFVSGFMGFTNIDLKVSTSIIFTIAFGIAVDDTIHFMSKLKLELNKGKSLIYALKRTYLSTGKAIMVTSIILCSGFFTLLFSTFASTYYIGLLVSITLFLAVIADLILLPVLLILFYRHPKSLKNRHFLSSKR